MHWIFALLVLASIGASAAPVTESCVDPYSPNPGDCSTYRQCDHGHWLVRDCPPGLHWNSKINNCDWPASAGCTANEEVGQDHPEPLISAEETAPEPPKPVSAEETAPEPAKPAEESANPVEETAPEPAKPASAEETVPEPAKPAEETAPEPSKPAEEPAPEPTKPAGETAPEPSKPVSAEETSNETEEPPKPVSTEETTPEQPKPSPLSQPSSSESENALVSQSEFECAAQTKDGHPDAATYKAFIDSLPEANIIEKSDAAMLLAHEIWETVGFQFTRQQHCVAHIEECATAYPNTGPGKARHVYYGRGMLQLTWDYNYAAASQALYGDDRLIKNPDLVADDLEVAFATASWFWRANVQEHAATFGETLKAINGALECEGGPNAEIGKLRFENYKMVLECLNLPLPPEEYGYCHV